MEKEKKIKTCEEYVLNVLNEKDNELALVKKELQELKNAHDELGVKYSVLCAKALAIFNDTGSRVEEDELLTRVYLLGDYIGSYTKEEIEENYIRSLKLEALAKLIQEFGFKAKAVNNE